MILQVWAAATGPKTSLRGMCRSECQPGHGLRPEAPQAEAPGLGPGTDTQLGTLATHPIQHTGEMEGDGQSGQDGGETWMNPVTQGGNTSPTAKKAG